MKTERSLGYSDQETVKVNILREVTKVKSRTKTLNLRADFVLFRDLLGKIPQETAKAAGSSSRTPALEHKNGPFWCGRRSVWMNSKLPTEVFPTQNGRTQKMENGAEPPRRNIEPSHLCSDGVRGASAGPPAA